MKYKELINFEPITEIVKFSRTDESDYQKSIVKTYVFSEAIKDHILPTMIRNLNFLNADESFGIQVVGNYGTGKSHLMSLVSLIAEDKSLLCLVSDEDTKQNLNQIAGKFKVLRFELGSNQSLWDVIVFHVERWLSKNGIDFKFENYDREMFLTQIHIMMASFEEKYPDKGFMIVIDEMLAYLKSRNTQQLNDDLMVLQALGQACDNTRFKIIFGVQELIYHSPEFQFASEMLQKVSDRYKDVKITKDDITYVVKRRLLKKDEHQKVKIRKHLQNYVSLFEHLHSHLEEYVELFPVHPAYFDNFQRIKKGKSQREVLKTLSSSFTEMMEMDIPENNPGLITYADYWNDLSNNASLMSDPDIRKIKDITDTIKDKISTYFSGARKNKKDIANNIANAAAIKALQIDLDKLNGSTAESLKDDLCITNPLADDQDLLLSIIESTAEGIVSATQGQFFVKNSDNNEYCIKIEGGVNPDVLIQEYMKRMSLESKDEAFYDFLQKSFPLDSNTYRQGFKIWSHSIEWSSHKAFRQGYIFFGNPKERSTTQPVQYYYMYFMPIFDETKLLFNNEPDEVYFAMTELSDSFKTEIGLYGAAKSLEASASSNQKRLYREKIDFHLKNAREIFNKEFTTKTKVHYQDTINSLDSYQLPGFGSTLEQTFDEVTSAILDNHFCETNPDYPSFHNLLSPLTEDNFSNRMKSAIMKITKPDRPNKDGEAMLTGLGLWIPGSIDIQHSKYAQKIMQKVKNAQGRVINRDDILECYYPKGNLWRSTEFKVEADLEFLVLSVLVYLGRIEIVLTSGKSITSMNLDDIKNLSKDDYFNFTHIKAPKGINIPAIRALFKALGMTDRTEYLDREDTYIEMIQRAEKLSSKTVTLNQKIIYGLVCNNVEVLNPKDAEIYKKEFNKIASICDRIQTFTTEAKLKNFPFSMEEIEENFTHKDYITEIEDLLVLVSKFDEYINYLSQTIQYIAEENLKKDVSEAINSLALNIKSNDEKRIKEYEAILLSLKDRYVMYYLEQYTKYYLSSTDFGKKQVLMDSSHKKVCDILKDADFLSTAVYKEWLNRIISLKAAENITKKDIRHIPYHNFNPCLFAGKPKENILTLREELIEIVESWTKSMKEIFDDPSIQKNLNLISGGEAEILRKFAQDEIELDRNNVTQIRDLITKVSQGLEKIEIDSTSLKKVFNKPLTPDEAVEEFKKYVDYITSGKDRNKIRIILN
ncbi:MAG: DUF6079 family protein [Candidatus Tenebribacter davisii]|nr:DUF6079 family protein [Candidatus Tenebribacter davisii]